MDGSVPGGPQTSTHQDFWIIKKIIDVYLIRDGTKHHIMFLQDLNCPLLP